MNYNLIYVLFIIIIFFLYFYDFRKDGFYVPYKPEERPEYYPDQSNHGNLIEISKYIYTILNTEELTNEQKLHLEDLLNLIQFI